MKEQKYKEERQDKNQGHVSSLALLSVLITKMEFTQTEKGQCKVIRHGYMYVFQKNMANNLTPWECKACIKLTVTDDFVEQMNEITCHPNPNAV